ncbi:histidine/lysine/arginine/ornithine ABC transporter ATP-binding protein [Pseudomonas gingeri NCPPB 3146 = LMG 5327]|uniref:ATP-binding cassette domain-containing protein n=2 Tax=Pseudomonas gingeri TaxID=117681 RepID=A0A7Y7XVA7_9PSED|nr:MULTISPECIES: ATP-binding cassette domain-containing protein [Pseudomonas]NVZ60499.1 ATP-binding cassette domain-containing protein [Pseudomonas gingeri]NVZ78356.1 ATP-binding cassette domain-containing protein [Pseudomonas gingeri]NWA08766.1 ATP-binding cassette domain-containing protein [Pseudomonas gingeri]NWC12726.1 ATP-binding cassette domain-containing protein [Pseudomonas gingeri]NWE49489.1 ATP-binding cassette domain-containing protein [Pseudomonas gingeri]
MCKLQVNDLHKSYGQHQVLKGVSLRADAGDVITLIGSSGSGKSTFLRCLNLLENPQAGEIIWDGTPIALKRARDGSLHARDTQQLQHLRTQLSMVFQSFNLWAHLSVLENVIAAPMRVQKLSRAEATQKALHYLNKVQMDPARFANSYPSQLSGGQQQRVAIARALAVEPQMLLLDEPTSALDPELVGEVLAVIQGLAREGRSMIMVTHEMSFARDVSSQVIFLHQGRIEEQGTPAKVFRSPSSERLKAFLGSSQRSQEAFVEPADKPFVSST